MTTTQDYPEQFLQSLSNRSTCDWCKHPVKPIYRAGLCRHCYDIRGKINRFRRKVEEYKKRGGGHPLLGPVPPSLKGEYRAALKMEGSAKVEGRRYGRVYEGDINGLDLEHEFSCLGRLLVRRDLYQGHANLFDWSFTPSQKRLLFYLLSLMSREHLRRTRWRRAVNSALYEEG